MNTHQGSLFTCTEFVDSVQRYGIQISLNGKGSWCDNVFVERLWKSVKYEKVHLHAYDSVAEAHQGLQRYFTFYNRGRRIRFLTAVVRTWSLRFCRHPYALRRWRDSFFLR